LPVLFESGNTDNAVIQNTVWTGRTAAIASSASVQPVLASARVCEQRGMHRGRDRHLGRAGPTCHALPSRGFSA
jgi:hypothetical protein